MKIYHLLLDSCIGPGLHSSTASCKVLDDQQAILKNVFVYVNLYKCMPVRIYLPSSFSA